MNLSSQGVRKLATVLGMAALLAVAGCDDGSDGPPSMEQPEVPTLERTSPDAL
jgi:hypothetical protein